MEHRTVVIGLIQQHCSASAEENTARTISGIREAAERGANIICTQELFATRYFCQTQDPANFDLAEPMTPDAPRIQLLSRTAKELGVVIIASLFEKRTAGLYHNTAAVFDTDGAMLGIYRKMHIPDDPHFCENFYFTPGDLGYRVFDTRFGRIGVLICWDQWYPEAARLTALAGARILFYPTAIGWLPEEKDAFGEKQYHAWESIQRSHAIANGCYVAVANRTGYEESPDGNSGIEFWGRSFVAGPYGEIVEQAPTDSPAILTATVDLAEIEETRRIWPFFRDRRIDSYGGLTRRYLDA